MKAVLLAAGTGERLRPFTETAPKCLIDVGGRSLLFRHLDQLAALPEIDGLTIVVGYLAEKIRSALAAWRAETGSDFPVTLVDNPAFRRGSILSLYAAKDTLIAADSIVMDADVLYDRRLIARLVRSTQAHCFLLDETATRTGEEMMVCARHERVLHIARSREPSTWTGWDTTGEGVGFFKLACAEAPALISEIEALLAEGRDDAEYETALDRFVRDHPVGFEHVGDLPWTEIDFAGDIERAIYYILPIMTPC